MNINKGKIAVFIDGNNLFHFAQQLNIEIDYNKLLKYVINQNSYYKAYFYGILDSNNDKQQGFFTWLKYNGYKVITKSYNSECNDEKYSNSNSNFSNFNNNNNNNNKRQTLDVELIVDIIKYSNHYDTAIIIAGSPELQPGIQYLHNKGNRIEWINLKSNTPPTIIEHVDIFIDLFEIKNSIEKQSMTNYEKYNNILSSYK